MQIMFKLLKHVIQHKSLWRLMRAWAKMELYSALKSEKSAIFELLKSIHTYWIFLNLAALSQEAWEDKILAFVKILKIG